VICTYDADAQNLRTADEYNLRIVSKQASLIEPLSMTVNQLLAAQRPIHNSEGTAPTAILLDFNRVSDVLIAHLAKHPTEIDRVN